MKIVKYILIAILLLVVTLGIGVGSFCIYFSRYNFSSLEFELSHSNIGIGTIKIINNSKDLYIMRNSWEQIELTQPEYDELREMINRAYRVKSFNDEGATNYRFLRIDRRYYLYGNSYTGANEEITTLVDVLLKYMLKPFPSGIWKSEEPKIEFSINEGDSHWQTGTGHYIVDGEIVEIKVYNIMLISSLRIFSEQKHTPVFFGGTFMQDGNIIYYNLDEYSVKRSGYTQIVFERIGNSRTP
jgi:hypothetical protein